MATCMFCESERVRVKRLPAHRREWTGPDGEHVEYMPASLDCECIDCERMWTIFDDEASHDR